ncbi:MAG TPA: acyl-CoA dehydrogenase family protein [Xanthobacteraceae bacterium]|jgi:alkylation response protein AidB-like acyl-CoA dehydrogenase|nr:acyl-CoA dehydrogenase family protein [Xanthobacteraceae bacterium]
MLDKSAKVTKEEMIARAKALAPKFATRAEAAEKARRLPAESIKDMLDAGMARILLPEKIGGYGLGFDSWFEVMRELGKADASHSWCAGLIIHHAHLVAQFPEAGQKIVWKDGLDVSVSASFAPNAQASPTDGGYQVIAKGSPFASGVDNSTWVILGAMTPQEGGGNPEWRFFLLPQGHYQLRDTWNTAGMRGTGSNTIVTEGSKVPADLMMRLVDLGEGKTPGSKLYSHIIYHTPFFYYAPISFISPMLGAVQGAYELFCDWTKNRKTQRGLPMAETKSIQVRLARAAADIDAADLLIRRATSVTDTPELFSTELKARSARDFTRASELIVGAIDELVSLAGTACFGDTHPIQRAWRDIHMMSMHISLNTEMNYGNFGRVALGLGRDPTHPYL